MHSTRVTTIDMAQGKHDSGDEDNRDGVRRVA